VSETLSRPERLMTAISDLRADDVLNKADPQTAHARLSGLLVGAEIAALKPYWLGQAVAIIGAETLCAAYARALTHQGVTAESFDAASLTRAGLWAALQSLGPTT
jgi:2-dehydro-3-deoxygalactonokinase